MGNYIDWPTSRACMRLSLRYGSCGGQLQVDRVGVGTMTSESCVEFVLHFFCLALGFAVFTLYGSFIPFVGMSEFSDAARLSNTFRWSFSRTDMAANFLLAFPTAYFAMGFANPKLDLVLFLQGSRCFSFAVP